MGCIVQNDGRNNCPIEKKDLVKTMFSKRHEIMQDGLALDAIIAVPEQDKAACGLVP